MAYSPSDEIETPRLTPAVLWLLSINVVIAFVQMTLQKDLTGRLAFSVSAFEGDHHVWTLATYMFAHGGFWHLTLNMYMLWAFGPRLERAWSTGAFTAFYLWCGLGGAAAHALLPDPNVALVGASAAIFGVIFAYARRWPDDEVYVFGVVPMKMRRFVWFVVAVNLVLGVYGRTEGANAGGVAYFAHLGGILFAWLYLLRPTAPSVDRLRQRVSQAPDVSDDPPRPVPRSLPRPRERGSHADEAVEKSKAVTAKQPRPVVPPPTPRVVAPAPVPIRGDTLDLVLDKISQYGLESLTTDERRVLDEESRRLRER